MTLYLGTDPSSYAQTPTLIHYPVIEIVPLKIPAYIWDDFGNFTHLIFTSKNGVTLFFDQLPKPFGSKVVIAIGQATAARLREYQVEPQWVADEESQEGVIELLNLQDLSDAYVLYPRSSLARRTLENHLIRQGVRYQVVDLYKTELVRPQKTIDLNQVEEIIFTSPTTVKGFVAIFGQIPRDKKLVCQGRITQEELQKYVV